MTKQEWIEQAKRQIEGHQETLAEADAMSSRDSYWPRMKHSAEIAANTIKFLQAGIRLMEVGND